MDNLLALSMNLRADEAAETRQNWSYVLLGEELRRILDRQS